MSKLESQKRDKRYKEEPNGNFRPKKCNIKKTKISVVSSIVE
jgi:predicted DNA-binding WGR domain protein